MQSPFFTQPQRKIAFTHAAYFHMNYGEGPRSSSRVCDWLQPSPHQSMAQICNQFNVQLFDLIFCNKNLGKVDANSKIKAGTRWVLD